jgi:hypothetical protein
MEPGTDHIPEGAKPLWPGSARRRALLKGAGLAGAAGVAGALLRSTDARAQTLSSADLWGLQTVPPSGDTTGGDDTTAINDALATGPVALMPGTYYVTQLTMPTDAGKLIGAGWGPGDDFSTVIRGGTDGESQISDPDWSMVTVPVGASDWVIQDITFSGDYPGGTSSPYTALISVTGTTTLSNDRGTIYRCFLESSAGDGIYIGEDRAWIMIDQCWSTKHANAAISIYKAECIVSRCALADSNYGYLAAGEMIRIIDSDIFTNVVGGIISGGRVSVEHCDHAQSEQQGLIVTNNAEGVSTVGVAIHSRFICNSLGSTGTYAHVDVSGAAEAGGGAYGKGGTTIAPGTMFCAQEFGDSQQVSYDINTGGNLALVNDYSTYATVGAGGLPPYAIAHIG